MKKSKIVLTIFLFVISISVLFYKVSVGISFLESNKTCSEEKIETSETKYNIDESNMMNAKFIELQTTQYIEEDSYLSDDVGESESIKLDSKSNYYDITYDEIDMLSRLVYLEAGGESYECMKGVASVVLNRMTSTGMSLQDVIYAPNQFSPACYIESTSYTDDAYNAVMYVVENGPSLPEYVTFFRADHYHDFGNDIVVPYTCINNTYFSADTRLMEG